MRILGLDLATRTGWAHRNSTGRIEYGVQDFSLQRGDSAGMRYVRFNRWLSEMLADLRPQLVAYEQTHQRGGAATEVAAGLATRVQEQCAERGINLTAVHSATLKKFATGKGNVGKDQMVDAAYEILGGFVLGSCVGPLSDDEADAIHVLCWAESTVEPRENKD